MSRFIVAGSEFTDPLAVNPSIHVFDGPGYDGQFYFRAALDPLDTDLAAHNGIRVDDALRFGRLTYPLIAFVMSAGNGSWTIWTLVLANVASIGVAAAAAADLARQAGRPPVFGLLAVASSGLVMSLSRDLCEPVMIAGLIAGVAQLGRRRNAWAAVAWTAAVLAHEQALVLVGAFALVRVVAVTCRRSRLSARDLVWSAPFTVFVGWQVVRAIPTGNIPIRGSGSVNIGPPLVALVRQLGVWLSGGMSRQEVLVIPELALLVATLVMALLATRSLPDEHRWLAVGLAVAAVFAACLSHNVWVGPAELRQVVLVTTVAWLVLIVSRRSIPRWLTGSTLAVWVAVAALRVVVI